MSPNTAKYVHMRKKKKNISPNSAVFGQMTVKNGHPVFQVSVDPIGTHI